MAQILDVTLRDGSYELDFGFTQQDVKEIGTAVEKAGINYIEIGHGQGLSASSPKNGIAKCTDEEYLKAAKENLKSISYGMFCIPGIAKLEDIDLLASLGGKFIRVGCNATQNDVRQTETFIRRAKNLGLLVFSNYMKTYTANDYIFAECVRMSEDYGTDVAVIVDSAGCMLPNDITHYYELITTNSSNNIKAGFHGHDNLGLAVWNSLHAMNLGCEYIDTSLQSLGRGAGNASTEQFIAILHKLGLGQQYRLAKLMSFSEEYIRSRVKFKGVSGLDTYCGIAGFHSGYMNNVREISKKYEVSPYDLIIKYCEYDRINMDVTVLENIAKKLQDDKE